MASARTWIALALFAVGAASSTAELLVQQDYEVLMEFKARIQDDWRNRLYNWNTTRDCQGWTSVSCNGKGRVVNIDLSYYFLGGSLPPNIGKLTELQNLYLTTNTFGPTLPRSLGNLQKLKILFLGQCGFDSSIFPTVVKLKSLTHLNLASNNLKGAIPAAIQNLKALQVLVLNTNSLGGPIPPALGNLTSLDYLGLGANALNGSIPSAFGNLRKLTSLYLNDNQLTGRIPASFRNLKVLDWLTLDDNFLSGLVVVPPSPTLTYFSVANNFFSGPLTVPTNTSSNCKKNLVTFNVANTCLRPAKGALGSCCPGCKFKPDSQCKAFCNALQPGGACGGHGGCVAAKSGTKCVCDLGYKLANATTCVRGK